VPNQHHENIFEIPEDTLTHLTKVSKKIATVYRDVLWVQDLNILQNNGAAAWQTVFHYHMHLIPRTPWDKMTFWWEANESLRDNYDEIKERLSGEFKQ
jgi:histidine triad (HIT) family protein